MHRPLAARLRDRSGDEVAHTHGDIGRIFVAGAARVVDGEADQAADKQVAIHRVARAGIHDGIAVWIAALRAFDGERSIRARHFRDVGRDELPAALVVREQARRAAQARALRIHRIDLDCLAAAATGDGGAPGEKYRQYVNGSSHATLIFAFGSGYG